MKISTLLIATVLFLNVASFAQQNCAYTFSWTKARSLTPSFSFCVTSYGTIGMIQSPIGTNHLDATNPVEGFAWYIDDNGGGTSYGSQIPGLGQTDSGVPTFSEPKGAGKLPLVASWFGQFGFGFKETITANPTDRTITIKFVIVDCGRDCEWEGYLSRAANPELDGNKVNHYGSTAWAGLAFLNHGLTLSMPETSPGCGGIDPAGASTSVYSTCGGDPFTGTGAIYADAFFSTEKTHHAELTFTYRVF